MFLFGPLKFNSQEKYLYLNVFYWDKILPSPTGTIITEGCHQSMAGVTWTRFVLNKQFNSHIDELEKETAMAISNSILFCIRRQVDSAPKGREHSLSGNKFKELT